MSTETTTLGLFQQGQRVRIVVEDHPCAGKTGTVWRIMLRGGGGRSTPQEAWLRMDEPLPADLRSFPAGDPRQDMISARADECAPVETHENGEVSMAETPQTLTRHEGLEEWLMRVLYEERQRTLEALKGFTPEPWEDQTPVIRESWRTRAREVLATADALRRQEEALRDLLAFLDTVPADLAFGPRERKAQHYIERARAALSPEVSVTAELPLASNPEL
jgi:hypothetical protein